MGVARKSLTRPDVAQAAVRMQVCGDPRPEPESAWDEEERCAAIAENAYYRAERRGFLPGFELEDWLAAEHEVSALVQDSSG